MRQQNTGNLCSGARDKSRMIELAEYEFLVFLELLQTQKMMESAIIQEIQEIHIQLQSKIQVVQSL